MNNKTLFNGKSELYAKARPSYADELFEFMTNTLHICSNSIFADVGSGTGIFTEQLIKNSYYVYGIEPNDDMRTKAESNLKKYEYFTSVKGSACDTTLPNNSVDYITAAQSFHWFDTSAFKKECQRILKPTGKVIIVYNNRNISASCNVTLAKINQKYCPDFKGFSKGINEEKCISFFNGKCHIFRADNSQVYDRQGYINRVLSSSYSIKANDKNYNRYISELNNIFGTFSCNGFLTDPIQTVAYIGKV